MGVGYIGILGKNMETATLCISWGLYRNNGKEHGIYYLRFRVLGHRRCPLAVIPSAL